MQQNITIADFSAERVTNDMLTASGPLWTKWFCDDKLLLKKGQMLTTRLQSIIYSLKFCPDYTVEFKNTLMYDFIAIKNGDEPIFSIIYSTKDHITSVVDFNISEIIHGNWEEIVRYFIKRDNRVQLDAPGPVV